MGGDVIAGLVTTAIALAAFLAWTCHELRRIDTVIDRRDRRD